MKSVNKIHMIKIYGADTIENTHPVFCEIGDVIDEEDLEFVGVSDDDNIFLRLFDYKINKIVNLLKNYFIIELFDVTKSVINGDIQKKYPEIDFLTPEFLNVFRIDNTSKNDILDKISLNGLSSLDELDKTILNN